jgi:hypothetical protein
LACLDGIRGCPNSAKALQNNRVVCRSQGKGGFGYACFCGAAKKQAGRCEIAVGN